MGLAAPALGLACWRSMESQPLPRPHLSKVVAQGCKGRVCAAVHSRSKLRKLLSLVHGCGELDRVARCTMSTQEALHAVFSERAPHASSCVK